MEDNLLFLPLMTNNTDSRSWELKGNILDICANFAVCLESKGIELHIWGKETEGNACLIFFLGARVPEHSHDRLW